MADRAELLTELSALLGVPVVAVRHDDPPESRLRSDHINGRWQRVALDDFGRPRRRGWTLQIAGEPWPVRLHSSDDARRPAALNRLARNYGRSADLPPLDARGCRLVLRLMHEIHELGLAERAPGGGRK